MSNRSNDLPTNSSLYINSSDYQYIDSYSYPMNRKNIISDDLFMAFFTCAPSWVDYLFILRNKIVKLVGLKNEMADRKDIHPPFKEGESYGIFTIFGKSKSEVIMGTNDKHLDFRVSLLFDESDKIFISTIVKFHNIFGRIYFFVIKHFHRLIVPSMIKKMAYNLELYC